ncbi:hypothetical protein, partial [Shewanella sp. SM32]|uniref:hypothetical protein n=1 Tax=Shewanella sp. SM32 TaxID=2912796 RepID=UPI0021D84AA1
MIKLQNQLEYVTNSTLQSAFALRKPVSVSEFPKGSPAKRPIYQRNAERFPDKLGSESTISIV